MAAALKSVGFDVVEALDADRRRLDGAMRAFTDKLASADVALFFYAGHGLQLGLQNYLVPIDAKLERERDLEFETVKLDSCCGRWNRPRRQDEHRLPRCLPRQPAGAQSRAIMGTRSAERRARPGASITGSAPSSPTRPSPAMSAVDGAGRNSPFTAAFVKP